MSNDDRIAELEEVLAQFLKPIKGIPFSVIMKSVSGFCIEPISKDCQLDNELVALMIKVAELTGERLSEKPIIRPRPNEVGNDIEEYILAAIRSIGLKAERPKTIAGSLRTTGYPDILIFDRSNRPSYIECKIYEEGKKASTLRSFYLSPSKDFKVVYSARHLLIGFGVEGALIEGSRKSSYVAKSFKIVDLSGLKCDVKYEFNSDNKRLYADGAVIAAGKLQA
jgi:hypothetical protein